MDSESYGSQTWADQHGISCSCLQFAVQHSSLSIFIQVGAAEGALPIRSENAVLTVTVPPEAPAIINGDALRTTEDTRIEVECVSRGGKPAAEVRRWQPIEYVRTPPRKQVVT